MIRFTDDPAGDVTRMYEEDEKEWLRQNRRKRCEVCGRPIACRRHYEFGETYICPACLQKSFEGSPIPDEYIDDMIYDYEENRDGES